jgi:hypothetical protein
MIRWIAVLFTLLALSGCVTTREVVYRDGYYGDGYADGRSYRDGYADTRYYERDGSTYSPSYSGRGDYYTGAPDYYYGYNPTWYVDYPAYYSLFWGFNRTWYDPYWYPDYYYGVTYYPRNYFSIGFGSRWGRSHYGYQYYSPYRHSWVDNYYDWSPWHHHSHNRHHRPSPRFGSARNEAERLARISAGYAGGRRYGAQGVSGLSGRGGYAGNPVFDRYGGARSGRRDADYGGRADPRQNPGASGYGTFGDAGARRGGSRDGGQDAYGARALPRGRYDTGDDRDAGQRGPGYGRNAHQGAQHEIGRYDRGATPRRAYPQYDADRPRRDYDAGVAMPRDGVRTMSRPASGYERGYDRGAMTRSADAPIANDYRRSDVRSRGYAAPQGDEGYRMPTRERYSAPVQESRSYAPVEQEARSYSAPSRGYDAGMSAPAPRYSEPAPSFESRSESRSESRREASYSDDGGVRRSKDDE